MGAEAYSRVFYVITLWRASLRSLGEGCGQSKGRVREVIFIDCCLCIIISLGLIALDDCTF